MKDQKEKEVRNKQYNINSVVIAISFLFLGGVVSVLINMALDATKDVAGSHQQKEASAGVKADTVAVLNTLTIKHPELGIEHVAVTPFPGVFAGVAGTKVGYFDKEGKYIFVGQLIDMENHKNLTQEVVDRLNKVSWSDLPLDKAIVSGDPNGEPIAIFTDPECPYCRHLEQELPKLHGVKIYTFLYPLTQIHPQAKAQAEAIWCSKDRHATLIEVMLEGKQLSGPPCETPIDEIIALGNRMKVNSTPTLFAKNGQRLSGYAPANQIQAWVDGLRSKAGRGE